MVTMRAQARREEKERALLEDSGVVLRRSKGRLLVNPMDAEETKGG